MCRDDLHYLISIKLMNERDTSKFHTVEILIPKSELAEELFDDCLVPDVECATIEVCNFRVVK